MKTRLAIEWLLATTLALALSGLMAAQWSDPGFVLGGWVPNTVNATPSSVSPGEIITANWSAPPGHSSTDWGRALPDRRSGHRLSFVATYWRRNHRHPDLQNPETGGQYEFRHFLDDGVARTATTNVVMVQ